MSSPKIANTVNNLDTVNSFWASPSLWVSVSFFIFVIVLARPAWVFVRNAIDKKIDEITDRINDATALREEAQDMLAKNKRKVVEVEQETEKILVKAREEAQTIKEKLIFELEERLRRKEKLASDRIKQSETDAVESIRLITIEIAINATKIILDKEVGKKENMKLIEQAIDELPHKLN